MTPSTTVVMAIALLSMGVVSLVLALVAGRLSVRGGGWRAAALSTLGVTALAGTVFLLWDVGWSSVVDEMLWPLLVMAIGFTLLFVLLHLIAMRAEILRRRVHAMQQMTVERAALVEA